MSKRHYHQEPSNGGSDQRLVRHAEDITGEFTACGWAYDAGGTEDDAPEIVMARIGETVTCDRCRAVIDHWRKGFSARYKSLPNGQAEAREP